MYILRRSLLLGMPGGTVVETFLKRQFSLILLFFFFNLERFLLLFFNLGFKARSSTCPCVRIFKKLKSITTYLL